MLTVPFPLKVYLQGVAISRKKNMLYTTVLQWVTTCMNSSEQAEITSYRQDNLEVALLLNCFHKKKQY